MYATEFLINPIQRPPVPDVSYFDVLNFISDNFKNLSKTFKTSITFYFVFVSVTVKDSYARAIIELLETDSYPTGIYLLKVNNINTSQ